SRQILEVHGAGIGRVQACVEQVTANVDIVDILRAAYEPDVSHIRARTAVRAARHSYTYRHICQSQRIKVCLNLSHHRRQDALGFGKCQTTGWQCRTRHGKTTCAYFSRISRDIIGSKQSCQWTALCFRYIREENVLLRGQANARLKFLDSVTQTSSQMHGFIIFNTSVLDIEA